METPYSQGRLPWTLLTVFLLFVASIGTGGYIYYQSHVENLKLITQREFNAIAQLKVNQVEAWRNERIADAKLIFENTVVTGEIKKFLSSSGNGLLKDRIHRWMESLVLSGSEYECASLTNTKGTLWLRSKLDTLTFEPYNDSLRATALQTKQIIFSPLHKGELTDRIHMDLYIPILDPDRPKAFAVGLLILELNADASLFPLVQSSPTSSQTSEFNLVRREGDEVVFLTGLRHKKNSALSFRLPLTSTDIPAVMAVRGVEGIVEAVDYRGVQVLAAVHKIPNSEMFLIAKIDKAEVFAPLRERSFFVIVVGIVLVVAAGTSISLLWRNQRAKVYRRLYEDEVERAALLENIDYLRDRANDSIILTNEQGSIIEVNERAVETYGYTAEEFLTLNVRDIMALEMTSDPVTRQREIEEHNGSVFESIHRRKNGATFPVEISSRLVIIQGKKFFQNINRDITERKRSEGKIALLTRVYAVLSNINQAIVRIRDKQKIYDETCRIIVEDGSFTMAWIGIIDEQSKQINVTARFGAGFDYLDKVKVTADDTPTGRGLTGTAFRQGKYVISNDIEHDERMAPWRDEALRRNFRSSGAFPLIVSGRTYGTLNIYASEPDVFDEDEIKLLTELSSDISFAIEFIEQEAERKRAEKTIREKEHLLSESQRIAHIGSWTSDMTGHITWTDETYRIYGVSPDTFTLNAESFIELIHPYDKFAMQHWIQECLAGQRPGELEFRTIRPDGTTRYLSGRGELSYDNTSKQIIIKGTVQDITDRKKAEDALRASEEQYKLLFKSNPHPMWVYDEQSLKFLAVNEAAINHYGYSEAEFLSMTLKDIRPAEDVPEFLEQLASIPPEVASRGIWRHRKKDGTIILAKITSNIVLFDGKHGKIVLAEDVTEQKKAEEAQRKLAIQRDDLLDRLQLQFDRMPLGYILINPELTILEWNPAAEKIFRYAREEVVGKSPYGLILSTTVKSVFEEYLENLKKGSQTLVAVSDGITKDGKTIICEWHNTPLRDESGQFIGFICMVHDITERKEAEKSLHAAEQKFRGLVEQSLVGIYIIQGNNFAYVNPKMAEIFGYTPEEIVFEKTVSDLVVEEDWQIVKENIRRRVENEVHSVRYGFRGKRKNGAPIFIEVFGARTEYNGQPAIIGTLLDVSDRRHAEESANRLLRAVEQTDEIIFMTEIDGTINYVNPAFEKLYGYTKEEVIGKTPRILKGGKMSEDYYRAFWRDLLAGKSLRVEHINKTKSGTFITVEASVNPVYSVEGIMTGFIAVQEDITGKKKIEEEKKLLENQIIQMGKMESVGTLAGGIAHDFNNILGIILGHMSLVDSLVKDKPKLAESIEAVNKAVQRGAGLVRQILTFARKTDTSFDTIDVNSAVEEIVQLLQQTFPKTITFSLRLEQHLPLIIGDHTQLHQTLLNLCVNARDAMSENGNITLSTYAVTGEKLREKFAKAQAEKYVAVAVSDTGTGMNEETLGRIFEPFFTTKERGKGTGLGLAVVYGVMASHGGFVDVTSEEAKGSTFFIYFPCPKIDAAPSSKLSKQVADIHGGNETILLVEDEDMLRELTVLAFEEKGYRVLTAIDGKEAIEVYKRNWEQISIVFSDEGLPKLGGWEAFIEMKKINPKIKAVLTSGYLEPNFKTKLFDSGVKGFIQKPYAQIEVLQKIREVIDSKD